MLTPVPTDLGRRLRELLAHALVRLVLILVTHTVFRLRVEGREHVPEEGGALLLPNHVSLVDGFLMLASTDRPIRFVVASDYYEHWLLKPFMRSLGAIPISSRAGPKAILRALHDAGEYLDAGEVVCVFPEGQISRTGTLLPFRRGLSRVVEGRDVPVIPVYLDRVWGSLFSYSQGRFLPKPPRRLPYPVSVTFGAPLPPDTPVTGLRQAVQEVGAEAWMKRAEDRRPLHRALVSAARRHPLRVMFADAERRASALGALIGAIALARALRCRWKDQGRVGVMLPPSVPGALVNLAAALSGRVVVNLNYTAGRASLGSAVAQAGLRTVVSSRRFVAKAGVELPDGVEPVWIEDVARDVGAAARLAAALLVLLPVRLIERACGAGRRVRIDDLATIIFSSGSTGEPKGVLLTHLNVDSNVEGAAQVLQVDKHDRLLGILPFFHSFGYMAALWLPVYCRFGVIYHPNPLDAPAIGELVREHRVTLLIATPTFLQLYRRRVAPADFGSLRLVIAGAEKLPPRLAEAFAERFGVRSLEGYGATECAPVVSVNVPDFRAPGFHQSGNRLGTVGQPLPGVAVRIVDPDELEALEGLEDSGATAVPGAATVPPALPAGEAGMILVRGPNVMQGYLQRPELTRRVLRHGWYVTGDVGQLDEDGFLTITDRLSRFSKIGGEMVPHGRVEELLHDIVAAEEKVFAVTAIADERRGERLAVLHTHDEGDIPRIVEELGRRGLPNLFIPRRDHFVRVGELPLLGSGKLDLGQVRSIASSVLVDASGRD